MSCVRGVATSWWVMLSIAGCGRLGFESITDGGGADTTLDDALICPNLYTRIDGSCYRFAINPPVELAWIDAEAACEADADGSHLMVADDDAEIAAAVAMFGTASDAWIGLSDRVTEDTFLSVTGVTPYLVWDVGEPNANGDCVQILIAGSMGDRDCLAANDYVCEYDGRPVVPSAF